MHVLVNIVNVFFGTVRRTEVTLGTIVTLWLVWNPAPIHNFFDQLLNRVIGPIMNPMLTIFIVIVAAGWIWKKVFPPKKRGK